MHASRDSAHDGEDERKRGLVTAVHRVNYTIFAALRVGFRGRFPWLRKVSVVRREQIRVLIKTAAELTEIDRSAGAAKNGDRALMGRVDAAHDKAREIPATVKQPTRAGSDELWENLRTAAFAD